MGGLSLSIPNPLLKYLLATFCNYILFRVLKKNFHKVYVLFFVLIKLL